jgi:predicted RNase H-like nuclease
VGVAWGGGEQLWTYLAPTVSALVAVCEADGPVAVVGVDVPIGLLEWGARDADTLAAQRLHGSRRASVFAMPVRAALGAPDRAAADAVNRAAGGSGVSVQAYGLGGRVLEVDGWLRAEVAGNRPPVYEVHPEVTFGQMAGRPLVDSKRTWAGAEQRRMLLAREGLFLAGTLGDAGRAAVDDVLDAAACAWTAARIVAGDATSLPDPPQPTPDGLAAAIWV